MRIECLNKIQLTASSRAVALLGQKDTLKVCFTYNLDIYYLTMTYADCINFL
jgi:hypothetical protein